MEERSFERCARVCQTHARTHAREHARTHEQFSSPSPQSLKELDMAAHLLVQCSNVRLGLFGHILLCRQQKGRAATRVPTALICSHSLKAKKKLAFPLHSWADSIQLLQHADLPQLGDPGRTLGGRFWPDRWRRSTPSSWVWNGNPGQKGHKRAICINTSPRLGRKKKSGCS